MIIRRLTLRLLEEITSSIHDLSVNFNPTLEVKKKKIRQKKWLAVNQSSDNLQSFFFFFNLSPWRFPCRMAVIFAISPSKLKPVNEDLADESPLAYHQVDVSKRCVNWNALMAIYTEPNQKEITNQEKYFDSWMMFWRWMQRKWCLVLRILQPYLCWQVADGMKSKMSNALKLSPLFDDKRNSHNS